MWIPSSLHTMRVTVWRQKQDRFDVLCPRDLSVVSGGISLSDCSEAKTGLLVIAGKLVMLTTATSHEEERGEIHYGYLSNLEKAAARKGNAVNDPGESHECLPYVIEILRLRKVLAQLAEDRDTLLEERASNQASRSFRVMTRMLNWIHAPSTREVDPRGASPR